MKKYISALVTFALPLMAEQTVLVFAGSTRADSYNKQLANLAGSVAKEMGATVTTVDLADYPMPFYDADLEKAEGMPANAKKLRELMGKSNVIMIASPEYNASVSAILKNSIDWVSRKVQDDSPHPFKGKTFALLSASPGRSGGARGLTHLRTILEDVGGTVLEKQVCVPKAHEGLSTPEIKKAIADQIAALK